MLDAERILNQYFINQIYQAIFLDIDSFLDLDYNDIQIKGKKEHRKDNKD